MSSALFKYYALVYLTQTGSVVGDMPLALDPVWYNVINDPGSWTVHVPVTGSGMSRTKFLEYTLQEGKFSVAICYGNGSPNDTVCQAGPIWSTAPFNLSEVPPIVMVGGQSMWGMLNARVQVASTWDGSTWAAYPTTHSPDTVYGPTSMQGVAVGILTNAVARDPLPIDIPSAIAGTTTITYNGYDLQTAGFDLQQLTQMGNGPDIFLQPYLANNGSTVRTAVLIGNPTLSQPGTPLYFDYPGNISQLLPSRTANQFARTVYVKGSGTQYQTLWASATDNSLTSLGFPLLEYVDSNFSSLSAQNLVTAQAQGDLNKYNRPIETWTAKVRMDLNPRFGSYSGGIYAGYDLKSHPMRPDGLYQQRIIGFQVMQGDNQGEVRHLLQSTSGMI